MSVFLQVGEKKQFSATSTFPSSLLLASCTVIAAPIPALAPVTKAILPDQRFIFNSTWNANGQLKKKVKQNDLALS